MNNKQKNIRYYRIRASVVWLTIFIIVALLLCCYYRKDIYNAWLQLGGREQVSYVGLESKLDNVEECHLCGCTDDSMMSYYRKFDTLGIVFLNDWNVLAFETSTYDENGQKIKDYSGTRSSIGNTEEYSYETSSTPSKGIAEVNVTLIEGSKPNIKKLQRQLCQECLDKVLESLAIDKLKNQKKEALPICLVDFQTLEVYSVQKTMRKLYLDDFYVSMRSEDDALKTEAVAIK